MKKSQKSVNKISNPWKNFKNIFSEFFLNNSRVYNSLETHLDSLWLILSTKLILD